MSSRDGKKGFGKFIKRLALCTAFAGAAAVGYNDFGTQADVKATVTSVEPTPAGDIIHTDQGDFVNKTSWLLRKDDGDVKAISDALKSGAQASLHVYGAQPHLLGMTPETFGIYRNIENVTLFQPPAPPLAPVVVTPPTVAQPVAQPVAAPQTPAPKLPGTLVVPQDLINAQGVDKEDATQPEACAVNDDFNSISKNTPRLARDLDIMRQLPLTGVPVFNMMKDPKNHMHSCEFPTDMTKGSTSTYQNNQVRIGRGTGTSTAFHEYFHAMQDVDENGVNMFSLTERDAVVANLLKESSAVAFELASRQEAIDQGLKFYDPPSITKTWTNGNTIYRETYTESAPATNPDNRKAFSDAYTASLAANASLDSQAREVAALQAGGQAVVRRLMQGQDAQWNDTNTKLVIENVNNNLKAFTADATNPGYTDTRDQVFSMQGHLPTNINFVPPEFIGPGADKAIDKAFNDLHFTIGPATPAQPATPSPAPPGPSS